MNESSIFLYLLCRAFEISDSATSMTLVSTTTPSGENLVSGKVYGFKLGGREYVKGTLTAGKVITGMTRGLSLLNGTTTGGIAERWGRGTPVELTDAPLILEITNKINGVDNFDNTLSYTSNFTVASSSNQIPGASWVYNNFVNTSETQTVNGQKTFTGTTTMSAGATIPNAPANNTDVANKAYVDAVGSSGAADANTTTKGIVEEATVDEINSAASIGGTGAKLFFTPQAYSYSTLASSTSIATTSNVNLGTTTLTFSKPLYNFINIQFRASTTRDLGTSPCFYFNDESTGTNYSYRMNNLANSTISGGGNDGLPKVCALNTPFAGDNLYFNLTLDNRAGFKKMGHMTFDELGTGAYKEAGTFSWSNTSQITSVSFTTGSTTALFSTTTLIQVSGN